MLLDVIAHQMIRLLRPSPCTYRASFCCMLGDVVARHLLDPFWIRAPCNGDPNCLMCEMQQTCCCCGHVYLLLLQPDTATECCCIAGNCPHCMCKVRVHLMLRLRSTEQFQSPANCIDLVAYVCFAIAIDWCTSTFELVTQLSHNGLH